MKKLLTIAGVIIFTSVFITSCAPGNKDVTVEGKFFHITDFDCDFCDCDGCGHSWREIFFDTDGTGNIRARDEKDRSWCEQVFKYSYDSETKTISIKSISSGVHSTIACYKFEGDYVYSDIPNPNFKGFYSKKYSRFCFH